jgi:O-antigen/teichoic acid export membrane protein
MNLNIPERFKFLYRSPLHKNAIFLIADNVLASALGFVFWITAARFYTEIDVGIASTLISAIGLLAMASTLGFTVGLIRFLPRAKDEEFSRIINSCFTISGVMTLILSFVFIIGIDIWSPPLRFLLTDLFLATTFVIFALTWTITQLLNGIFISARRAEYIFLKNSIITSSLKLALLIMLSFLAVNLAYYNIYYSWGFATVTAIIFSLVILMPKVRRTYKPRIFVESSAIHPMMRFSAGNYVAIFFGQVQVLILPLMITKMIGAEVTAYFYLAWMMSNILFIIPSAVATSLLSEMSHEEIDYEEKIRKAGKFIAFLLLIGIIIFLLLADKLLLLFGTNYSVNASTALQLFAISSIPMAINGIFIAVKNARKEVKYVILVNVAVALGTLILSYLTMIEYGVLGIAASWLVSQSSVAIIVSIKILSKRVIYKLDNHQ